MRTLCIVFVLALIAGCSPRNFPGRAGAQYSTAGRLVIPGDHGRVVAGMGGGRAAAP